MMSKTVLIAAAASLLLQGCAITIRDPRDRSYDPPPGRALFEQIPNWQGEAHRQCGGRFSPEERQRRGLSDRC